MINDGIPAKHFTRVVRADPDREGLLYAGTEQGMYVSFDDGESWGPFQLNLPIASITDLTIKNKDLIVATQGRSFWVLDDLTLLHQWRDSLVREELHVFESRPVYRFGSGRSGGRQSLTTGQNASGGVPIRFWLRDVPVAKEPVEDNVADQAEAKPVPETLMQTAGPLATLEIRTIEGDLVRRFSSDADRDAGELSLEMEAGINEVVWDRRYPAAKTFGGLILWAGGTQGPEAIPGTYQAVLNIGVKEESIQFELLPDPRFTVAPEDFDKQLTFLLGIRDKLTTTHEAIETIRDVRNQIQTLLKRLKDQDADKGLLESGEKLTSRLTEIEETLYQTKSKSGQDPLNYPIRLNNRLSALVGVVSSADGPPTNQAIEIHDMVVALIDQQLEALETLLKEELKSFNEEVAKASIPAIFVK